MNIIKMLELIWFYLLDLLTKLEIFQKLWHFFSDNHLPWIDFHGWCKAIHVVRQELNPMGSPSGHSRNSIVLQYVEITLTLMNKNNNDSWLYRNSNIGYPVKRIKKSVYCTKHKSRSKVYNYSVNTCHITYNKIRQLSVTECCLQNYEQFLAVEVYYA